MIIDIDSIVRKLLIKYPSFGSVIANLKFQASEDIITAGTDGKVIFYNPKFVSVLSDKEKTFLFAHEVCHIVFEHMYRREGKDKICWSIATDAVINALLKQDGLPLIKGGVDIPEAANYDAEEMYDKLLKEKKKQQEQQSQQDNAGQPNSQGNEGQPNSQGNEGQSNPQSSGGQQGQQNSQMQQNSQGGKGQQNTQDGQEQQNLQGNERQQSQQNSQRQESSQVGQGQQQNMKEKTEKQSDVVIDSHELWDNKIEERKKEELEKNQGQQNSQGNEGQPNPQSSEEQQNSNGSKGQQGLQKQQEQQNSPSSTRKKSSQTGQGQQQKIKEKIEEQEDIGHDTHSLWDKAIKERQKTEKFVEKGEKETFKQNRIERRKQLQELSKELVKEATCGTEIQRQKEKLPDIGIGTPLIDWRRALRQAIKHNEEWTRKNARMRNGYFRYRLEETPMPETEIILDTSGSVSEILLRNFLRECKNILIHSKIKVGCFNTEFHGFTELKRLEDIDNIRLPIGGGTDFDVAVNAFSRRVPNKIIFTDGLAPMPEKVVKNVIWIVYGNKEIHPKGGKVINVNDEQLKKLCHFVSKDKSEEISR